MHVCAPGQHQCVHIGATPGPRRQGRNGSLLEGPWGLGHTQRLKARESSSRLDQDSAVSAREQGARIVMTTQGLAEMRLTHLKPFKTRREGRGLPRLGSCIFRPSALTPIFLKPAGVPLPLSSHSLCFRCLLCLLNCVRENRFGCHLHQEAFLLPRLSSL